jgi:hypothetical protein
MADKNDLSEVIAEMLITLRKANEFLRGVADNTVSRQEFENFAKANLDKFENYEELLQQIIEDYENGIKKLESE